LAAIAILASLFSLFILLISVPVDFTFHFNSSGSPSFRFQIRWLFSLVKVDIGDRGKKKPQRTKRPMKKKVSSKPQFAKFVTRPLILRFLQFASDLFHAFHFKQIDADLRAGLGEPAGTGMLWGSISAALPFLATSYREQIRIVPDFGYEPVLEGSSTVILRFSPIKIVSMILTFVFSKPVMKSIKGIVCQRRSS